jgi:hypothetical protein
MMLDQLREAAKPENWGSAGLSVGSELLKIKAGEWIGPKDGSQRLMMSAITKDVSVESGLRTLCEWARDKKDEPSWVESSLPSWIASADRVKLKSLAAGVEKESDKFKVIFISLGLGIDGQWAIVDRVLEVSNVAIDIGILSPEDPELRELDVSVGGVVHLAGAEIAVSTTASISLGQLPTPKDTVDLLKDMQLFANHPGNADNVEALLTEQKNSPRRLDFEIEGKLIKGKQEIEGKLIEGKQIGIGDIARHFGFAMDAPDSDPLRDLVVRKLEMRCSTRTSSFAFLIELGAKDPKDPAATVKLFEHFALRDIKLSVEGSPSLGMAGTLGCTIALGPDPNKRIAVLHLSAEFGGAGGGWIFEGDIEVDLKQWEGLFEWLGSELGFARPGLPKLPIKSRDDQDNRIAIRFLFNTGTSEINLTLQAALDIGTKTRTNLDIFIVQEARGRSSVRFRGALDLSPTPDQTMRFDLAIDRDAQRGFTVSAVYADDSNLDLVRLANQRIPDLDLPKGLAVSLAGAAYAYRRQDAAPAAKPLHMLAFNVKGKMDVGAIEVPGVKFVQDSAGAGISLQLDFQFAWASAPIEATDPLIAAIGAQGFQLLPGRLAANANFGARLRIGEETHTLAVPVECQREALKVKDARGENDVYQKYKPTTQPGEPPASGKWIDLHRQLGPLRLERVGMRFDAHAKPAARVALLLDAGFTFAGLQVSLNGLEMSSPLDAFKPEFAIAGLGVAYRNPSIEIGGALLRYESKDGKGFAGGVIVRTPTFSLSAIGDFSELEDPVEHKRHPSLFIYAALDYPLGGPPFFFVTGLAAGLGYNRDIVLPEAEEVEQFPLVAFARPAPSGAQPAPVAPAAAPPVGNDPLKALAALQDKMPPAIGSGFAAIGVFFTSFKIVNSFALLVAKFGPRFELDLIGTSKLVTPPGDTKFPLAQATLNLRARFVPEEGYLSVRAVLGADSFVLSRSCHVTGGFAFAAWFKDSGQIKAGDFVLSLGGYHPAFPRAEKYPHYPVVPRLGLEWAIDQHLSFKGSLYFALTAGAVMAGGRFEAVWQSDNLRVSFVTSADFLMTFVPYHYDVTASISLHVDLSINVFGTHHVTLDAGADLHLWGPDFSGRAHLHLHVIVVDVSFDVEFGGAPSRVQPVSWTEFRQKLVPAEAYAVSARTGLLEPPAQDGKGAKSVRDLGVFSASTLELSVESAIPFAAIEIGAHTHTVSPDRRPAVRPAALEPKPECFETRLAVRLERSVGGGKFETLTLEKHAAKNATVLKVSGKAEEDDAGKKDGYAKLRFSPIYKAQPAGLWGKPSVEVIDGQTYIKNPEIDAPMFTDELLVGFVLGVWPGDPESAEQSVRTENPVAKDIDLPGPPKPPPSDPLDAKDRDELLRVLGMRELPAAA